MEKPREFWHAHTLIGQWALGLLAVHLFMLILILLLLPPNIMLQPALRTSASTAATLLAYLLVRRGWEILAAIAFCVLLELELLISALVGHRQGIDNNYTLILFLAGVIYPIGTFFGRKWMVFIGIPTWLILFLDQSQYSLNTGTSAIYLIAAIVIYFLPKHREKFKAKNKKEKEKDQGTIKRYDYHTDYVEIRMETRLGDELRIRVARGYFQELRELGLQRGDYIVIDDGINRAENDRQYIQALSISIKVDRKEK